VTTDNKDFKVKNGLIVQGSSATVAGNQILTTGSNLTDLNNVNAPSPSNGQSLIYNSSTSKWVPAFVEGGEGGSGGYLISTTPPENPEEGDAWFNSSTGRFYIFYDNFWIENTSSLVGPQGPSGILAVQSSLVPPQNSEGSNGDIWIVYS
jgi:hypothetical protein